MCRPDELLDMPRIDRDGGPASTAGPEAPLLLRGSSPAAEALRAGLARLARNRPLRALVTGAPGTGRTDVARWLHRIGTGNGECVVVSCARETDAHAARRFLGSNRHGEPSGYLERCANGTLVLDDVSLLPLHLQRLVVGTVESGRLPGGEPDGENERGLVAVLREPLRAAFCSGRLGRDLYHALASWEIELSGVDRAAAGLPILSRTIVRRLDRDSVRDTGTEHALVEPIDGMNGNTPGTAVRKARVTERRNAPDRAKRA